MSTVRSFNNMLNEYLTNDLLSESLLKRDWMIKNVPKDNGWKGGSLIVPFYGTTASSIKMGGLTAENNIAKHKYVRGSVTGYKEAWGSLRFEHGDLIDHDGKVNEKSFLKILPNQIDEFADVFKEQLSKMLLTGSIAVRAVDITNAATGVVEVDRIERLVLDQKFQLLTAGPTQTDVYVIAINLNTNEATFSFSRGGAAADLTTVTIAVASAFYYDGALVAGVETNSFSHLKGMLLSAANGGSASLYGQSKLAYPYLQAINVDGSSVTVNNIKTKLFDAYNEVRKKARGNANTILMSFKWMAALMANIEQSTTPVAGVTQLGVQPQSMNVSASAKEVSVYGWTEITITSVKGTLKVVAIQEMDDDSIMLLDMSALKYYSNGEIVRKRVAPDGKNYYEVRDPVNGYFYIVDTVALGELILLAPTKCGIIHSIP